MADNVNLATPTGIVAADDVGGFLHQRVKTGWGPDGTFNETDTATGKPLPIQMRSAVGDAASFNAGATDAGTLRVVLPTDQMGTLGRAAGSASVPMVPAHLEYETVAASQTNQMMGATGNVADYIEGLICVVATAATSQVQIKDGNGTAITVLPNNVGGGVGTYYVPLGLKCVNATTPGWQITTAAGVSVIATGDFT